jgi:excisionase family DNA binding protein
MNQLTRQQVAQMKNVHPETVRRAIRRGELPAQRFGQAIMIESHHAAAWNPRPVGRPARKKDDQ